MGFCCKVRCGAPIDTTVSLYLVNSLRPTDRKHADERRRSGWSHCAGHGRHDRGVRTGFRVGPHGSALGGQGRRGDLPPGAGTRVLPCRAPHGRSRPRRRMCPALRPAPAACVESLYMCALMPVPVPTCGRVGGSVCRHVVWSVVVFLKIGGHVRRTSPSGWRRDRSLAPRTQGRSRRCPCPTPTRVQTSARTSPSTSRRTRGT